FKKPYRGTFTLSSDGKKLSLVDTVALEQYLYGVVPSEMPSGWALEALKAQAVASRSYALALRKTTGIFDVYGDTRSQVYGGMLDVPAPLNASGRASTVTAIGDQGQVALSGSDARTALSLRSTWFRVGVLALDPIPRKTVEYGTPVTLTGLGRGLPGLRLEQLPARTTTWQTVGGVTVNADGTFEVVVKAAAPVQYRVTSGGISTAPTTLLVAPKVRLKL